MDLFEILVPATDKNGQKIPISLHKEWDSKVLDQAGGMTILRSTRGRWSNTSGSIVQERMIPVRIACTSEQIESIASMTANHYDQEAVMFYRISNEVHIRRFR